MHSLMMWMATFLCWIFCNIWHFFFYVQFWRKCFCYVCKSDRRRTRKNSLPFDSFNQVQSLLFIRRWLILKSFKPFNANSTIASYCFQGKHLQVLISSRTLTRKNVKCQSSSYLFMYQYFILLDILKFMRLVEKFDLRKYM